MVVSGDEDALGTEPVGLYRGHCAVNAELASLVGTGGNDASWGHHADDQGLAPILRVVALFYRGEECIEIHMEEHLLFHD